MEKCKFCGNDITEGRWKYFHEDCVDKFIEWRNEQDGMICPYCGYEFDDYDKIYDEGTDDVVCPECGNTFEVETTCTWGWESRKKEEDYKPEEEDGTGTV